MTATNDVSLNGVSPQAPGVDQEPPPREGGLGTWAPSIMPPVPDLTDEQALACAFRILAHGGFSENMAGHITWQRPGDDHMLVNPWGLWWEEITASDLCTVDADANVLSGKWDVTPAIHIHTELHRRRPDARVVIHNHPYWVSVMAAVGILPEIVHQNGSMFYGDLDFVNEYTGEVDSAELGADLATLIGDAKVVFLASHGIIVTGSDIRDATFRAATIERLCKLAFDVHLMGKDPFDISPSFMVGMKASQLERALDPFWDGAVRLLLRREPDVLD